MNCSSPKPKETVDLLIVDDDKSVCKSLLRLFRKDDLRVQIAYSGEEALKYLSQPVRVVLSDNRMPGISGVDLLEKFLEADEKTYRILLTGHAELDTLASAINNSRVHKYTEKPWDSEKLRRDVFEGLAWNSEQYAQISRSKSVSKLVEKAKEDIQQKDEEVKRISHDMRNPLCSMKLGLELAYDQLEGKQTDAKLQSYMEVSLKSIDHLTSMTYNLSNPEKLADDKISNISEIAKEVHQALTPAANNKKLRLELNCPKDDLYADMPTEAVYRIVFNLVNNAIKFTESGSVRIHVSKDLQWHICEISDTGAGMASDEQEFVFEKGNRLSHHKSIDGTGSGLAICKELVETFGGDITLSSEIGKGSSFSVYFPHSRN